MSKSKSNYHIFKFNDNNNKNTHKMHMKNIFSDEYSNNQTIPKKINVLLTSINSDIARFKIRKELTKKLLSTDRESYTYRTNINKDEIIFNKTHKNFNLKFFSKVKKHNYIKSLFKNFLKSLQKHFFHMYTDFESYFNLFLNENEKIKNSDLYQYDIFKSVLEKFKEKNNISKNDITTNNLYLIVLEELLRDYVNLLIQYTSNNCTSFILNFLNAYKRIMITNFEIYSEKISIKDEQIKTLRETMDLLKERISNFENIQYDKDSERKRFEESKKNLENIIETQSKDIDHLRAKISELEGEISIKDYKIKMLSNKQDEKKVINNLNENIDDEYEERLGYKYLLKERLERIRYKKFKTNIQNKNLKLNE